VLTRAGPFFSLARNELPIALDQFRAWRPLSTLYYDMRSNDLETHTQLALAQTGFSRLRKMGLCVRKLRKLSCVLRADDRTRDLYQAVRRAGRG